MMLERSSTIAFDESDRLTVALFRDLAELDTDVLGEPTSPERRTELIDSAISQIDRLIRVGGGAIGIERLETLRTALVEEPVTC